MGGGAAFRAFHSHIVEVMDRSLEFQVGFHAGELHAAVFEMMQFHPRIPAQFAKSGRSLHGAVAKLIEPAEQISCSDF